MITMKKKNIPAHLLRYFKPKRIYKPKDDAGIPSMLYEALLDDGWYRRSDIIYSKINPMPESVRDRPTKSHEHLFLLAKSKKYYYDVDAIREPHQDASIKRDEAGFNAAFKGRHTMPGEHRPHSTDHKGFNNPAGRNKRTVWTIPTQSPPDAHFATFPMKLVEPCILAGSSPKTCGKCGDPYERMVEKQSPPMEVFTQTRVKEDKEDFIYTPRKDGIKVGAGQKYQNWRNRHPPKTTGWQPTCKCEPPDDTGRSIVLDPFIGSGTTALVAKLNHRDYIGIDLSEEYCKMAEKRLAEIDAVQMELCYV